MSDPHQAIKKISRIDAVDKVAKIDQVHIDPQGRVTPSDSATDKTLFDALMTEKSQQITANQQRTRIPKNSNALAKNESFLDELTQKGHKVGTTQQTSETTKVHNVQDRARKSLMRVKELRQKLIHSSNKLKPAYNSPLKNKFSSIQGHLKVLSKSLGIKDLDPKKNKLGNELDFNQDPIVDKLPKPIRKFVLLLTDGQKKLEQLDNHLLTMSDQELSPAKMLAIQIKMGHIAHSIELFTSLLNKALESTKSIMNTQV